jgi:cytochrome P450
VSLVRAPLIAGNETTTAALSSLFYVLATCPDVLETLQRAVADRMVTRFVEAMLRNELPVRGLSRITTCEVELGRKKLPKGAHLLILYGSACNDEAVFPDPRRFDLNRRNLGRHGAFGAGIHRCIGAPLARMEIKVTAQEVVKRLDHFQLAVPPEEIRYIPTVASHSIQSLRMTLRRRNG